MPLCTLEVPDDQLANMSPTDRKNAAISVCNQVLDLTLEGLAVPNPEDREIRVLRKPIAGARMSISFTVGPNEYPDFPGKETFDPSTELIHAVGLAVQAQTSQSPFEVVETRMESWRDTTFLIVDRSATATELPVPPELANKQEIGAKISEPKVTLVLSPEILGGNTYFKEGETSGELKPYIEVAGAIYQILAETLGLDEPRDGQAEVLVADSADTNFSVEFDCQPQQGYLIPEAVRQFAAKKVEQLLNNNPRTHEGAAEV